MGFVATLSNQVQDNVDSIVSSLSENEIRAITFDQVKQEVLHDQEMQDLISAI